MMENVNCLRCRFRHEDNGNCTAVGGFCTAVAAAHCPLLREYLDTGLTPEEFHAYWVFLEDMIGEQKASEALDRFRQLVKADRDGRIVVLPCKEGDTVWIIPAGKKYAKECKVDFVNVGSLGTTIALCEINGSREQYGVTTSAFENNVFLTREEAEKALEAMKDG